MSAAQRTRWSVVVAALVPMLALTAGPVAAGPTRHGHGPSAQSIAASRHVVARDAQAVRRVAAQVGRAHQQLRALRVQAETSFEAYDGARVKLAAAGRAVAAAHLQLGDANAAVDRGQARITRFVTLSYESGGLGAVEAYLAPGGPAALESRVGALNAIDTSEQRAVDVLQAARIYQGVISRQAETVAEAAAAAAATARRAKTAAETAVARQASVVTRIRRQQARLSALLTSAQAHVSALQRRRLAAIARARAAAAAREAAAREAQGAPASAGPSPYSGVTGSLAGTASAATESAAVQAAETQLGKPYVWAAAGPDSYDCSGLTLWAYAKVGISLEHWTGAQWVEGAHISRADLRPGDLVFFATDTSDPATIHHVGMYVGNGQMIDAPYTGVDVRYDSVFRSDYIGAVRPYQR